MALKKQLSNKNKKKQSGDTVNNKLLLEGGFIFAVFISIFIFLSLASYTPKDNWLRETLSSSIVNAGGKVGAFIANILFYAIGYLAYLLPVALIAGAWLGLKGYNRTLAFNKSIIAMRTSGFLLFLLGACGLLSVEDTIHIQRLPYSGGGALGLWLGSVLVSLFNVIGASVLILSLLFVGFTLLTGLSWFELIERIGNGTVKLSTLFFMYSKDVLKKTKTYWLEQIAQFKKPTSSDEVLPERALIYPPPSPAKRMKKANEELSKNLTISPQITVSERLKKAHKTPLFRTTGNKALPSVNLLKEPEKSTQQGYSNKELEQMSFEVEQQLMDFGLEVNVVAVHPGPVITRFELQLAPGIKVSKITALAKDLARSLSKTSVRVVEVIPGKSVIGLELPNHHREMVCLREVLATEHYARARSPLSIALGVDIAGYPVIVDLAKMPHLLVAGTTGSGKSVGINAMLLSLLFKATPDDVRLILVDPKMLELSVYEGIPHLLTPVVTDMKDAANALRWSVAEMERRYRLMAALGVRNLNSFNHKVKEALRQSKPISDPLWVRTEGAEEVAPLLTPLPYIVIVIDELADMMMVVGKKVDQLIARIAQKARAAGIHLVLATQRPSVDVLTGLIKSNVPTRISYQVSSKIDSRTILDQQGAEQLLGHGDLLYLPPGKGTPTRVHGAFVDDMEVHSVVQKWREFAEPDYIENIIATNNGNDFSDGVDLEDSDPLYDEAVEFVIQSRKASISSVQRRFKIGYNRAARLVEEMERTRVVGPMEGSQREVLVPPQGKE